MTNNAQGVRPVAVVTGASRGVGRGIASELSRTHTVVGTYRERQDAARSLQEECGVEIFRMDLTSPQDRDSLLTFCRGRFGQLDLLVNNAGIAPPGRTDLLEASEESFDDQINTNLKGTYLLTQAAARWMCERKSGRIIFITSISSYAASTDRADYCVSKAGLSMAAQLYAARLARDGIAVFEIRPGIIETDMAATLMPKHAQRIAQVLLPQSRLGAPRDVALAVRAIADGRLDYSTGQVLDVDGGFHLRRL